VTVLRNVTPGSLAEYLGLTVANLPSRRFDLVIARPPCAPSTSTSLSILTEPITRRCSRSQSPVQ
jgi:hypothetical protein